jgi:transposase-like protein
MVANLTRVIHDYEERVRSKQVVPLFSHDRHMQRSDGGPKRAFFGLFGDHAMAIDFLKDIGLIRRTMQCNSCHRDMTWSERTGINDKFKWRCQRRGAGARCNIYTSIRHGSWFQQSNPTLFEILILTYDIVCRDSASNTHNEYCFSSHTVADWGMFCRETMLVFLEGCSVKIGCPNKTVEIDESKFGRRKYHRGHPVKGQWVFGGVERESGATFLVRVKDRTADTLMAVLRDWVEPGTRVISDGWSAYIDLGSMGFTHQTVNHSIHFVDPNTGAHTNTIKCT